MNTSLACIAEFDDVSGIAICVGEMDEKEGASY
jgi:hypothetical protein